MTREKKKPCFVPSQLHIFIYHQDTVSQLFSYRTLQFVHW